MLNCRKQEQDAETYSKEENKLFAGSEENDVQASTSFCARNLHSSKGEEVAITEGTMDDPCSSDMDITSDEDESDSDDLDSSENEDYAHCDSDKTLLKHKTSGAPLYVAHVEGSSYFEAPITFREHAMAVSAFAYRHNLSDTGIAGILKLISLHLPQSNLLELDVRAFKKSCGFKDNFLHFYKFCDKCGNTFSDDLASCPTPGCNGTRSDVNHQQYFATGTLNLQVKQLLERHGIWESIQETTQRCHGSTITDIVDGLEYQKLKEDGQFLSCKNNITMSMFTDGVALFSSSGISLWPVYLIVNEIPRHERFMRKNMILWGIWQGPGKPNMTIFLRYFVQDLQRIYHEGVLLNLHGKNLLCKAKLVLATMDLQARASVFCMTQHNGQKPCIFCHEVGEIVKSGAGHCRSFPYHASPSVLRTDEDIQNCAKLAQETHRNVDGFLGDSVFNYLPGFSLANNVAVDYMHGILLGIVKRLLKL